MELDKEGKQEGRLLHEAAEEVGASWTGPDGPTWERKVGRKVKQSRIDLVFVKVVEVIGKIRKAKLASDQWGLLMEVEGDPDRVEVEREAID